MLCVCGWLVDKCLFASNVNWEGDVTEIVMYEFHYFQYIIQTTAVVRALSSHRDAYRPRTMSEIHVRSHYIPTALGNVVKENSTLYY